jgi:hypothetical protein
MQHHTAGILRSLGRDQARQSAIEALVLQHWRDAFGTAAFVPIADAEQRLFSDASPQVRANFRYLWESQCDHRSRFTCTLSFIHFLELFLRYGTINGLSSGLEEITPIQSVPSGAPLFTAGIAVGASRDAVLASLCESPEGSWVFAEGSIPATFRLLAKGPPIDARHTLLTIDVFVDAAAENSRFSVGQKNGGVLSASSWNGLVSILRRNPALGLQFHSGCTVQEGSALDDAVSSTSFCFSPTVQPDPDSCDWNDLFEPQNS